MNRDDIIRLARERHVNCEYTEFGWQEISRYEFSLEELLDFVALVAAHEREECAKLCDDYGNPSGHGGIGNMCAEDIRARGEN